MSKKRIRDGIHNVACALLTGLTQRAAVATNDQTITVNEIHVIDQVRKRTERGQNPTVRRENLEYDFTVY